MARQAAKARMGFYPIDPVVIDQIAGHLSLPDAGGSKSVQLIDPCCGEGHALKSLADRLGVPQQQVYGIELDGNRAATAKALMPDANIAGPASFFGMRITGCSFSLAYCNPPFDSELGGGGREEQKFAEEATRLLCSGGVLVLVCPLGALNGNLNFCKYLDSRYENMRVFAFPDGISPTTGFEYRRFREICIIATKRRSILTEDAVQQFGYLHQMQMTWMTQISWERILPKTSSKVYTQIAKGRPVGASVPHSVFTLPTAWKPLTFHKSQYLPEELAGALASSPLQRLMEDAKPLALARPPIAPGKGHIALLLAAGQLDGVVEDEGENHVIRGTAKKVEYYNEAASTSTVNPETGALTTKDVYSQMPVVIIRTAWQDGTIQTLSNQPEPATEPTPTETNPDKAQKAKPPWES